MLSVVFEADLFGLLAPQDRSAPRGSQGPLKPKALQRGVEINHQRVSLFLKVFGIHRPPRGPGGVALLGGGRGSL